MNERISGNIMSNTYKYSLMKGMGSVTKKGKQAWSPVLWRVAGRLSVSPGGCDTQQCVASQLCTWVSLRQQHGSVYWKAGASRVLTSLSPALPLRGQLQVSVARSRESEKLL